MHLSHSPYSSAHQKLSYSHACCIFTISLARCLMWISRVILVAKLWFCSVGREKSLKPISRVVFVVFCRHTVTCIANFSVDRRSEYCVFLFVDRALVEVFGVARCLKRITHVIAVAKLWFCSVGREELLKPTSFVVYAVFEHIQAHALQFFFGGLSICALSGLCDQHISIWCREMNMSTIFSVACIANVSVDRWSMHGFVFWIVRCI